MKLFEDEIEDKKYIAVQGNEYGLSFDGGIRPGDDKLKFVSLQAAEKQYSEFFDEDGYGAGAIMKINEDSIEFIKSNCNL